MKSKKFKDFPSCEGCIWKKENLEGVTPCEICIRNPQLPSKRWTEKRDAIIQGIRVEVPRDMYVSEDMFEILKTAMEEMKGEIDKLKSLLLIAQMGKKKNKGYPYPKIFDYPYPAWRTKWEVTWVSSDHKYDNVSYSSPVILSKTKYIKKFKRRYIN